MFSHTINWSHMRTNQISLNDAEKLFLFLPTCPCCRRGRNSITLLPSQRMLRLSPFLIPPNCRNVAHLLGEGGGAGLTFIDLVTVRGNNELQKWVTVSTFVPFLGLALNYKTDLRTHSSVPCLCRLNTLG